MELNEQKLAELQEMANRLRVHSIKSTNVTSSGHPTSCASAAEVVATLFFHTMHYNAQNPRDPSSDRFILSKGHAAPVLYAAWAEAGYVSTKDLWTKLRLFESDLEGHPTPRLAFVDVATGSLGQGLSCAAGMAYVGKHIDKASYRVYCMMGDGESAEGSVWEALAFGGHYKLDNLCAIIDVNRLGQSDPTMLQHHLELYEARGKSFGWHSLVIDGHDMKQIAHAFDEAQRTKNQPTLILSKSFKGHNFPGIENLDDWHGKALGQKSEDVLKHLVSQCNGKKLEDLEHPLYPNFHAPAPDAPLAVESPINPDTVKLSEPPNYKLGQEVATRAAYGTGLVKLGASCDRVIALDGDVKNSTFSIKFKEKFPERFVECYIAEQNLVGVAMGASTRGRTIPFASTFACFLTRAYDQLRMGGISQINTKFCGSHSGVSIGEDGPSQMALEDLGMFRSLAGSAVLYPCDAVSCERAIELAARHQGIAYIRTSRPATKVIYANDEHFALGKAKVVKHSEHDSVTVVGAGITVYEALKAAEELEKATPPVHLTVVDIFSLKPIDAATLVECVTRTKGRLVTVEDHYEAGGLGEAVLTGLFDQHSGHTFAGELHYRRLAVRSLPRSGKPMELVHKFGIDSVAIKAAVQELL